MGISGKNLQRCRSHLARVSSLLKKFDDVEVAMAMSFESCQDPAYKLKLEQISSWVRLFQDTPSHRQALLRKAWSHMWQRLIAAKRPWLFARGPMAAALLVLFELLGWEASCLDSWRDPANQLHELDYQDPALQSWLVPLLRLSIESFLWAKAEAHQGSTGLGGQLPDLTVAKRKRVWLLKHSPHRVPFHDMLLQGALAVQADTFKQEGTCPACGRNRDTLQHRLWECPQVGVPCILIPQSSNVSGCGDWFLKAGVSRILSVLRT